MTSCLCRRLAGDRLSGVGLAEPARRPQGVGACGPHAST